MDGCEKQEVVLHIYSAIFLFYDTHRLSVKRKNTKSAMEKVFIELQTQVRYQIVHIDIVYPLITGTTVVIYPKIAL